MSADDFPDFDLSFLDGTTGSDLTKLSKDLEDAAADLQAKSDSIDGNTEGTTVDQVRGELTDIRTALESSAANAAAAAAAFAAMKSAWDKWKADAPRQAEIAAAEQAVAALRKDLMEADPHHAALYRPVLDAAKDHLNDLIDRREAADAALAAALEEAQLKLGVQEDWEEQRGRVENPVPPEPVSAPPPGDSAPKSESTGEAAPAPGDSATPGAPGVAAAPADASSLPSTATSPSAADTGTALSPAALAALGAAAGQQPQAQPGIRKESQHGAQSRAAWRCSWVVPPPNLHCSHRLQLQLHGTLQLHS